MSTHDPWSLAHRRFRPCALATFVATTTIAVWLCIFREDAGETVFRASTVAFGVGLVAALALLCLLVGFVINSHKWMRAGFLAATFVFTARFVLYLVEVGVDSFPMWISLSLAVGTAGAYLLDRADHRAKP